uniref:Uncharacterized protein n=1 Tax=Aegilops tauschii subsp. strangulata TaxID=200361 RepID=A0A452YLH8_AEGTS
MATNCSLILPCRTERLVRIDHLTARTFGCYRGPIKRPVLGAGRNSPRGSLVYSLSRHWICISYLPSSRNALSSAKRGRTLAIDLSFEPPHAHRNKTRPALDSCNIGQARRPRRDATPASMVTVVAHFIVVIVSTARGCSDCGRSKRNRWL